MSEIFENATTNQHYNDKNEGFVLTKVGICDFGEQNSPSLMDVILVSKIIPLIDECDIGEQNNPIMSKIVHSLIGFALIGEN